MTVGVMVRCGSCTQVGTVNRVSAGLRCGCGSDNVDLYQPGQENFLERMGAAHGPGTGWDANMPDPLQGWNEYVGPKPGPNPRSAPKRHSPFGCEDCKGSKINIKDGGICRACGGTGTRTPPTSVSPAPQVAKHPGQTSTPFMGRRKTTKRTRSPITGDRVARMAASVREQNPGLGRAEIEHIVRYTLSQYGE